MFQSTFQAMGSGTRALACAMGAGVSLLAVGATQTQAATIVTDVFSSGSQYGSPLGQQTGNVAVGKTPSGPNLPGGTWQHVTGAWYDAAEFTVTNGAQAGQKYAHFHNNAASGLTLGAFNTGSLTISSDIRFNGTPGGISPGGPGANSVAYLGFTDTLNTASNYGPSPATNFTGLRANGLTGALTLYSKGAVVGSAVAFGGTYDPTVFTTLTYTINTATGAISNVSFGSSSTVYSFSLPGTFLNSYTSNIMIGGTADNSGNGAQFSNLNVADAAVPEPATMGVLSVGAMALAGRRRRTKA